MRTVFLHFESVMQPLGRMADAAGTIQWLYHLAEGLSAHTDVRVVLFGEWKETFPPASGMALVHALGKRIAATATPTTAEGAIESYLRQRPDILDFVVLADIDTELPAPLQPYIIVAEPPSGLRDHSAVELRQWLAGRARLRDTAVLGSSPAGDAEVELAGSPEASRMRPETVIATVTLLLPEFQLVHLEGPDALSLSIGEDTPGVDWRQLQLGQRVECDLEGTHWTRVIRARVLSSDPAASSPPNGKGPTR